MRRQLDLVPWLAKKKRKTAARAAIGFAWFVFVCWLPYAFSGSPLLAGVKNELSIIAPVLALALALWTMGWLCAFASLHVFPDWWASRWVREQNEQ